MARTNGKAKRGLNYANIGKASSMEDYAVLKLCSIETGQLCSIATQEPRVAEGIGVKNLRNPKVQNVCRNYVESSIF